MKTTKIAGLFMASMLALSGVASAQSFIATNASFSASASICSPITHYLFVGSRDAGNGGDVTTLQNFLHQNGYLSVSATGYFGLLTQAAVVKFQAANDISAVGVVGPLTRALFSRLGCGSGGVGSNPTSNVQIYSMTPTSGPVGTSVSITGTGFTSSNIVHFGGGAISNVAFAPAVPLPCNPAVGCNGNGSEALVFTVPSSVGPYCAAGMACPMYLQLITPGTYNISVTNANGASNTVSFTVTGSTITPPPNSAVSIYNIAPTSGTIGTPVTIEGSGFTSDNIIHFGSGVVVHVVPQNAIFNCPMMAVGSTVSCGAYSQTLTFTVPNSLNPLCLYSSPACAIASQQVTPGTYPIYVENGNGTSNTTSFIVTGNNSTNGGISISGLDAPASLALGQTGVWTVHATLPAGSTQNLHYSVNWGDQPVMTANLAASSQPVQTSATFTHAYSQSGTYTAMFNVTDDSGHSTSVNSTITVTPLY